MSAADFTAWHKGDRGFALAFVLVAWITVFIGVAVQLAAAAVYHSTWWPGVVRMLVGL